MNIVSNLLQGKHGIVMGVANERSIAWGIAKTLSSHGAGIAFSYQSEALFRRLKPLAETIGSSILIECDVASEDSIDAFFKQLTAKWSTVDFFVHAIAHSDKDQLKGNYYDTTKDNFLKSLDISCYSFTSLCRRMQSVMSNGGSMVTLSYLGSERVMPNYNVMGIAKAALESSVRYMAMDLGPRNIRVNAISAGPIRTLASAGINDFRYILKWNQHNSPLRRNTTPEDVGGAAVFLVSDLGAGVTGDVIYVDSGYHSIGMKAIDAPDISTVVTSSSGGDLSSV
ncbi:MAG: SDR family oxidoreductase [Holosporales bacterium]|jgi:enoyl-[acyl-carrier protein] reductase I|nr:SDR family oxidoreductase [Holosporales bacterium]